MANIEGILTRFRTTRGLPGGKSRSYGGPSHNVDTNAVKELRHTVERDGSRYDSAGPAGVPDGIVDMRVADSGPGAWVEHRARSRYQGDTEEGTLSRVRTFDDGHRVYEELVFEKDQVTTLEVFSEAPDRTLLRTVNRATRELTVTRFSAEEIANWNFA